MKYCLLKSSADVACFQLFRIKNQRVIAGAESKIDFAADNHERRKVISVVYDRELMGNGDMWNQVAFITATQHYPWI